MDRLQLRRLLRADTQLILDAFTTRQFIRPHQRVADMLPEVIHEVGCCPVAVEKAMEWLGIDPMVAIGRLRRTELMQLARSIQRFWRNSQIRTAISTSA